MKNGLSCRKNLQNKNNLTLVPSSKMERDASIHSPYINNTVGFKSFIVAFYDSN